MGIAATTVSIILTAVAAGGSGAGGAIPLPHEYEVKAYASTMAIAKTASDACADILIDTGQLGELKDRFHLSEADRSEYVAELDAVFARLTKAIADAPSRKAWCDNIYELYGPRGTMIRDLMRR